MAVTARSNRLSPGNHRLSSGNRISLHSLASYKTAKRDPKDARSSIISQQDSSRSSLTVDDPWPVHPIACMRGPFQESIVEAMDPDARIRQTLDAATRRLHLLELDKPNEDDYASRWRKKPGAKYHPLWKLISQIAFGIHLLHMERARSEEEVIRILQTHVDEIDGFLEDVGADFDLALRDIDERLRLLLLPLEHGRTFSRMLRDRAFRKSIIEGNDVIERICTRTRLAMGKSLEDVEKGLEATFELAKFLEQLGKDWTERDEDMQVVYTAMRGNAEGWHCAFSDIQKKSEKLKKMIRRLERIVSEVERQAGIASRRKTRKNESSLTSPTESISKDRSPVGSSKSHSHATSPIPNSPSGASWRASLNKPLPPDPHHRRMSKRAEKKHKSSVTYSQSHSSKPSEEFRNPVSQQSRSTKPTSPAPAATSPASGHVPTPTLDLRTIMQDPSSLGITFGAQVEPAFETARENPVPISAPGRVEDIRISLPVSPSGSSDANQVPLSSSPAESQEAEDEFAPLSGSTSSFVSQVHRPSTPLEFSRLSRSPLQIDTSRISTATQIPWIQSPSETSVATQIALPKSSSDRSVTSPIQSLGTALERATTDDFQSNTSPRDYSSATEEFPLLSPSEPDSPSRDVTPPSANTDMASPTENMLQQALPKVRTPELHVPTEARPKSQVADKHQSRSMVEAYEQAKSTTQSEKTGHARDPSSPPTLTHTGSTASDSSEQEIAERELLAELEGTSKEPSPNTARPILEIPRSCSGVRARIAELEALPKKSNTNLSSPTNVIPRPRPGVPARKPVARKASDQPTLNTPLKNELTAESSETLPPVANAPIVIEPTQHDEVVDAAPHEPEPEPKPDKSSSAWDVTSQPEPNLGAHQRVEESMVTPLGIYEARTHEEAAGTPLIQGTSWLDSKPDEMERESTTAESLFPKRTSSMQPALSPSSRELLKSPALEKQTGASPSVEQRMESLSDDPPILMIASFADIRRFSMSSTLERPRSFTSSMSEAQKSTAVERRISKPTEPTKPLTVRRTIATTTLQPPAGEETNHELPDTGAKNVTPPATCNSDGASVTPPSPSSPSVSGQRIVPTLSRAPPRSGGRSPGPYKLMPDIKTPPLGCSEPMSPKTALPQWPQPEPNKRFRRPSMSAFKGMLFKKNQKPMNNSGALGGHVALV